MDFDIHSLQPDNKSDLLWLIQQSLDGDFRSIEALIDSITPEFFQVARLFSPDDEELGQFELEGLVFLLWKLKEYDETEEFEHWWLRIFLLYVNDFWAEFPPTQGQFPLVDRLTCEQIEILYLQESGLFSTELLAPVVGLSAEDYEHALTFIYQLLNVDEYSIEETVENISRRITNASLKSAADYQIIAAEAARIFLQRRENVRKRLVLFQLVWGVFGILFLAGAFQFAGNIFVSGEPVVGFETPSIEEVNTTLIVIDVMSTPTATPRPFERNQANGPSYSPDISADGRWIVYSSDASNLSDGDTNGAADIFLYDRLDRTTKRITVLPDGTQADGPSYGPSISPDGGWIAFVSFAENLVPQPKQSCSDIQTEPRPCADVYLYEASTGNLTLVSQINGTMSNGDSGMAAQADITAARTAISNEGQFVAFYSKATNLGADPAHGGLFVFSKTNSQIFRVDNTFDGSQVDGASYWPSFSSNGNLLAFQSDASNLVADDLNQTTDVFIYDLLSTSIVRVTIGLTGTGANGVSVMPSLDELGTTIVFRSNANELVSGDFPIQIQIYSHNLVNGETQLVSKIPSGQPANGPSNLPSISGDGKSTAFISLASDFADTLFNGTWDVYVADLVNGEIRLLTSGLGGQAANGPSSFPQLSEDGLLVVFLSAASNLVPNDENQVADIFLYQREAATIQRINTP